MWNDEEKIEIDDLDTFCRVMRTMAYFDVEASSKDDPTDEEKENFINQQMDENPELSLNEDLEELLPLNDILELVEEKLKTDPITKEDYISCEDATELERQLALKIFYKILKDLEELGFTELCWDSEKEDFTYNLTELGKKMGNPFECDDDELY